MSDSSRPLWSIKKLDETEIKYAIVARKNYNCNSQYHKKKWEHNENELRCIQNMCNN